MTVHLTSQNIVAVVTAHVISENVVAATAARLNYHVSAVIELVTQLKGRSHYARSKATRAITQECDFNVFQSSMFQ